MDGDNLKVMRPIRRELSTPLWLQLKHALRDMLTFDLRPGDQFPTEVQIGEAYNLSRVTVRQAITSLVDEGLLERRQGRGTFVLSVRLAETLSAFRPFLLNGFDAVDPADITVHNVETVPVPDWIGAKLGLGRQEQVFKIRKVLTLAGERVAFRTSYLPQAAVPRLLEADMRPPLIVTLEQQFGFRLVRADETIEFIVADEFRSEMLGVAVNHPMILVERVVGASTGHVIKCSRTYYKADRFRFRRSLQRDEASDVISEQAITFNL